MLQASRLSNSLVRNNGWGASGGQSPCQAVPRSHTHAVSINVQSRRPVVHMFPRDADFATQQLQGIIAELRADPALAPLLDDQRVAAAIKEIAANPANLQKHASNPKVMRVLERLLGEQNLPAKDAAAFAEAGTSPTQVLAAMSADQELSTLLNHPTVRTALAQIRQNPTAGLARWGSDPLVTRALDLLEAVLGQGSGNVGFGAVVDVVAEEVKQQQQQQQRSGSSGSASNSGVPQTLAASR